MSNIPEFSIGTIPVGEGRPPYLVAEIAWGHDGQLATALKLIEEAKNAGAHAVGLHITDMDNYMTEDYRCLDGQTLSNKDTNEAPATIFGYLKGADLSHAEFEQVFAHARNLGIHLCVMCNDRPSFEWVKQFNPEVYALPAAAFVELDFVEAIAKENVPTVLRIGGATLGEVEDVINIFRRQGNAKVVILHGIQLYPTKLEDLNLGQLPILRQLFDVHVGLADHIDGACEEAVSFPLMAVPMGAVVIEKHFTDDRANKREDFEAALGAKEFKLLASLASRAALAIGRTSFADLSPAEIRYRKVVRKKVVAAKAIAAGETLGLEHLICKRTDAGGDPKHLKLFLGRTTKVAIPANGPIDFDRLA